MGKKTDKNDKPDLGDSLSAVARLAQIAILTRLADDIQHLTDEDVKDYVSKLLNKLSKCDDLEFINPSKKW